MKRDLTHAFLWDRSPAHVTAFAAGGGWSAGGRGRRAVLIAALALFGTLLLSAPASAFVMLGSFDGSTTPAGGMVPERMAVNERTNDVYVIDSADDAVDRFSSDGRYLGQMTGADVGIAGTLSFDGFEDDIAVDNSNTATQGNVYIAGDLGRGLLTAFNSSGRFLWQVDSGFPLPSKLSGVAVDPTNGSLWIADRREAMRQLSPVDGSPLPTPPVGSSIQPAHIAFDSTGDLYAAPQQDVLDEYPPPIADPPARTGIDAGPTFDVETDSTNGDVYDDHSDSVLVYDSAGTLDSNSPFASGEAINGIAVNGPADRIYVSNITTNTVEIWAHQLPVRPTLTVTADGTGSGRVDGDVASAAHADSGGIADCTSSGGTCSDSYDNGTLVRLTATPGSHSTFTGWSGADAGACANTTATECDVTVDASKSITATFDPIQHTVRVTKTGSGSGTVTSSPAGINCGAVCAHPFDEASTVTLRAAPGANSTFAGWSGGGCSGTGDCRVTVNADTTVTATFNQNPPAVVTGGASGIGETTATVGGSVNPNGANVTDCHVDYGTTTAYGSTAACSPSPGSGTSAVSVSASLSSLTASTDYHYRVVATNVGGTTTGDDATFRTATPILPPPGCPQDPSRCTPGTLRVAKSAVTVRGSIGLLKVACIGEAGGFCRGSLTFKATIKVKVRRGHRTVVKKKTIIVGKATFAFGNGASGSLSIKLTSAGKKALKTTALVAKANGLQGTAKFPKAKPARRKRKHKK